MAKIKVNEKLSQKIYKETNILIEPQLYILGKKDIYIESPSTIKGVQLQFEFNLGAFTHFNAGGFIKNCTIGRYCSIAQNVKIGNGGHPTNWLSVNACQYIKNFHEYDKLFNERIVVKKFISYKHTIIGNDVWIGANVFIKDGVTIGNGAIIGANSVVTHDVEPYAIVAGSPAKIIRYRFSPEIIEQLQELQWWNYNIADFGAVDFDDIEKAIAQLKEILPTLTPYKPKHIIDRNYFAKYIPYKESLFGLLKTAKDDKYKYKYFCGIKLYKKRINKKGK